MTMATMHCNPYEVQVGLCCESKPDFALIATYLVEEVKTNLLLLEELPSIVDISHTARRLTIGYDWSSCHRSDLGPCNFMLVLDTLVCLRSHQNLWLPPSMQLTCNDWTGWADVTFIDVPTVYEQALQHQEYLVPDLARIVLSFFL